MNNEHLPNAKKGAIHLGLWYTALFARIGVNFRQWQNGVDGPVFILDGKAFIGEDEATLHIIVAQEASPSSQSPPPRLMFRTAK